MLLYCRVHGISSIVGDVVTDSEIRARLVGVEAMTGNFDFLFGLVLGLIM